MTFGNARFNWFRSMMAGFGAIAVMTLIFVMLPMTHELAQAPNNEFQVRQVEIFEIPPPPPIEYEPPEEEKALEPEVSVEVPVYEETIAQVEFESIEIDVSASIPTAGTGKSFGLPEFGLSEGSKMGIDIFELSEVDQRPVAIVRSEPDYDRELKKRGIKGKVIAEFVVQPDGSVSNIVIRSASHRKLARGVEDALKKWRFKPGEKNGKPVHTRARQAFAFGE